MSMFPHTVTIYNMHEDLETGMEQYNITILRGVFLDISKAANVMKSGVADADAAMLYIPMSIQAINAKTGREQRYIGPKEYERLDDVTGFWTLRTSGKSSATDCFFLKGEITEEASYRDISRRYDDVFDVTSVDTRDFGSKSMWHWQVGGK